MRAFFVPAPLLLMLFFATASPAQTEVDLLGKWDYRRQVTLHDKISKVIAASNGAVVAVGETISSSLQDVDGLFLVIDPEEGKEIVRKTFGGAGNDSFHSLVQDHDGTFILVGYTAADKKADQDGWLLRLDAEGNVLQEERPGGPQQQDDVLKDVAINTAGDVLAVGYRKSKKTAALWSLSLGKGTLESREMNHTGFGMVEEVAAARDGGFVLVGSTGPSDEAHPEDVWIMKLDKDGRDQWGGARYFGDRNLQEGLGITATADGGFAIAGVTNSKGAGLSDKWLLRVNDRGDLLWERTYGRQAEDIAAAVIELSGGGFAVFGQTRSYMQRASTTMLELLITDAEGQELESNTYPIYESTGNETAQSLVELFNGDLIIAGNSESVKDKTSVLYIGAYTYKPFERQPNAVDPARESADHAAALRGALALSDPVFIDNNGNQRLESGERGYFALEVRNQGKQTLDHLAALVSAKGENTGVRYWDNIKIGTLRAGQSKRVFVPVHAQGRTPTGELALLLDVVVKEVPVAGAELLLRSDDQPEPAALTISEHSFMPAVAPGPDLPIRLTVELENSGAVPVQPFFADLEIPPGVKSTTSERQAIPGLRPGESYTVVFSFTYGPGFSGPSIPITFSVRAPDLAPVRKTFHLSLGQSAPAEQQLTAAGVPDEIVWVAPDPGDYESRRVLVNQRDVELKVIALSGKPLARTRFHVLINGKKHQGQKMDEAKLGPPAQDAGRNRQTYSQRISLLTGVNHIQVVYQYEDGTEFKSPSMDIEYQSGSNPNLYVYSIGIAHSDLKYTVKDARDIANEFAKLHDDKGIGFKKIDIRVMTEKEETNVLNIRNSFIDLTRKNIKKSDLVVVFISSHGKVDYNRNFILMPSDFDPRYEETTSINFEDDILNKLKLLDANILVLIDACHSGSAVAGSRDFEEGASKVMSSLIEASSGVEVIASCSADEYSFEDDSWQNGAFTKAILEAFQNKKVEIDGKTLQADIYGDNPETLQKEYRSDGAITIEELTGFLQQRVPYLVEKVKNKKQNPTHKSLDRLPRNTGIFYRKSAGDQ